MRMSLSPQRLSQCHEQVSLYKFIEIDLLILFFIVEQNNNYNKILKCFQN